MSRALHDHEAGRAAHASKGCGFPDGLPSVPDHELIRIIGRGSYGSIWLARTVTGIWRAVKVVERDWFQDERPFEREFEGVRRFEPLSREHPALVDILQTGRAEDGRHFYYVMELADDASRDATGDAGAAAGAMDPGSYMARTLQGVLRQRRRLTADEALHLGCRLAAGLEFLHGQGLIHRDIKPSNIIFAGEQPKLADIGLVTGASDARSFVGTEGYVAPEGPNSIRADLYSLGMVLYEAGMGRHWHEFPEIAEGSVDVAERRRLMELNAILLKACATDPARRYEDASRMRADLERVRRGGSVRRRQWMGRWARHVAMGTAAVLILAGSITLGTRWRASLPSGAPSHAAQWAAEFHAAQAHEMILGGDASGALMNLSAVAHARGQGPDKPAPDPWQGIRQGQLLESMPRLTAVIHVGPGIASAGFSPDGRRLAVADKQGGIAVWDAPSGQREMGRIARGTEPARVRFSRDGRRILVDLDGHQRVPETRQGVRLPAAALDARSGHPLVEGPAGSRFGVFSPDDQWLASAMDEPAVVVQDAVSGNVRLVLRGHRDVIVGLVFSHDARRLASMDNDGWIRVWDLAKGRECSEPFRTPSDLGQFAFTSDPRRMATVHVPGTFRPVLEVWDLEPRPVRVSGVEFPYSPDLAETGALGGRALFLGEERGGFSVRSLSSDAVLGPRRTGPMERCVRWALAPDGLQAATGGVDGTVRVWNMETGMATVPPLPHAAVAGALAFSPDASQLAVGTEDGLLKVWDLARSLPGPPPIQPKEGVAYVPMENVPYPAGLSADGRWMATVVRRDGALRPVVIDLDTWTSQFLCHEGEPPEAGSVTWGHRSAQLATFGAYADAGTRRQGALLWTNTSPGWKAARLPHAAAVAAAAFTPDDAALVTRDVLGTVRVWRTRDAALLHTKDIPLHGAPWATLAPTGQRLISLEAGGLALRFTDPMDREVHGTVTMDRAYRNGRFSPDGACFASIQGEHSLRVFHAPDGREATFPTHPQCHARAMDWSPDGRRLVIVDDKSRLHLLHVADGRIQSLEGVGAVPVRRACFGMDGRCIAVADEQDAVWILDADTLAPVTLPFPHEGEVHHMVVTPSSCLVTVSDPDQIRRWDLKDHRLGGDLVQRAAAILSGRRPRAGMVPEWLSPDAMRAEHARLRDAAPHLVQRVTTNLQAWRLRHASSLNSLPQVEAAALHLAHLVREVPRTAEVTAREADVATRLLPPRAPETPPQCLDLSARFTHSPGMLPGRELSSLPVGCHVIEGTSFDLRGIIRLEAAGYFGQQRRGGHWVPASLPASQSQDIPVRRACKRLVFLHGVSDLDEAPGQEVARWRVHYQDGSTVEFPLRHGLDVSGWKRRTTAPAVAGERTPAWTAPWPAPDGDTMVRLYKLAWNNPRPDAPVQSLDFVLPSSVQARPFVVAITAEP